MLEDFTRLNEVFGINEPMFLPKEENIEYISVAGPVHEDIKRAISESLMGRKRPLDVRKKISESHKGKILKQSTKEKLRQIALNMPQEQKDKIADSLRGHTQNRDTWLITFNTGKTVEVFGLRTYCRENNYNSACLYRLMKGERTKHKDIVAVEKLSKTP
tara:strand:- start:51 stop:530 length:480 start_codon:yes stop_codon:yes gene_type:complete